MRGGDVVIGMIGIGGWLVALVLGVGGTLGLSGEVGILIIWAGPGAEKETAEVPSAETGRVAGCSANLILVQSAT